MSTPIVVHMVGVVPIPVGHEVEVRVFLRDTAIFGTKIEPQLDAPLLVDLATGIMYGEAWHFQDVSTYRSNSVRPDLPLTPRADLEEHGRWQGRVTAVRIAWIGANENRYPQTSLTLDPIENERPYR